MGWAIPTYGWVSLVGAENSEAVRFGGSNPVRLRPHPDQLKMIAVRLRV